MTTPSPKPLTMSIGGATYDLFVRTNHEVVHDHDENDQERAFTLPLGAKIRVQDIIETCGGGASNTSVGLARLGCNAFFSGVIGSDQWGEKLLANFKKEGVNTDCVTIVENEVSSFSIILSASGGERVILYDPGTNAHLHDSTFDRDALQKMEWVYLNHIQEDSCIIQNDITKALIEREDICLTWNPGGCQIDVGFTEENNRMLLAHTNLLLLNKEEALAFTKTKEVQSALESFLEAGVERICITDGRNGATATDGVQLFQCPVLSDAKVVDTTGAGDAFGTGVTWGLLRGEDLSTALKIGTINAASVVGAIGAQAGLLTDTDIAQRLQSIDLNVTVSPL